MPLIFWSSATNIPNTNSNRRSSKTYASFWWKWAAIFYFIANQFALDLNGKEYRIDLLFFHRGLQSLVAIDLKIGEFEPEHTGKMSFYLSLLDKRIRKQHENPCIGIIICKSKDQTTVEFALQDVNKPIGVATYSISKSHPKELSAFFPSPEELIKRVEAVIKSAGEH